jgi:hypothetical protein
MKVFSSPSRDVEPSCITGKMQRMVWSLLAESTAKKFQADRIPTNNYLFNQFAQLRPNGDSFPL